MPRRWNQQNPVQLCLPEPDAGVRRLPAVLALLIAGTFERLGDACVDGRVAPTRSLDPFAQLLTELIRTPSVDDEVGGRQDECPGPLGTCEHPESQRYLLVQP